MTKRYDPARGKEVVELGYIERWVAGLVAAFTVAMLSGIGYLVWTDHERLAEIHTRVAILEARGGK